MTSAISCNNRKMFNTMLVGQTTNARTPTLEPHQRPRAVGEDPERWLRGRGDQAGEDERGLRSGR
jgi:hypothetical protein